MTPQEYRAHRKERYERLTAERQAPVLEALAARDALHEAVRQLNLVLAVEDRRALVRFHASKRRAAKLRRTPSWADMAAIRLVYERAAALTAATGTPHHVDHEYPLQGALVSGLHVHNNLQVLTGVENSRKHNHFEVT